MAPTTDCTVKFKALSFEDHRKNGSTLKLNNIYIGNYRASNRSIWWTDPGNDQNWVFWLDDTAAILEIIEEGD